MRSVEMRNRIFFLVLMIWGAVFSACDQGYKIERGTDFYYLVKALSIKFEALQPDSNFVIAKSKNYEVTANELLHVIQDNEGLKLQQWRNHTPVQIKKNIRSRAEALVVKKEMLQRAEALHITATDAEVDSAFKVEYQNIGKSEQEYLGELNKRLIRREVVEAGLRDRILIAKYMDHILADELKVSDEELQQAYQKSRNISFRHILFDTVGKSDREKRKIKRKLERILKKINSGADFSEMAKKHTQDRASANTGGLYQDQVYGGLDSAFAVAAFSTAVGEVSDVAESVFGYHIIKVIDRKNEIESLEDVKPKLVQRLKQVKLATASPKFVEDFKKEIGFEILK